MEGGAAERKEKREGNTVGQGGNQERKRGEEEWRRYITHGGKKDGRKRGGKGGGERE